MDFSSIVETVGKSIVRVEGRRTRPSSGVVWGPNRIVTVAHAIEGEGEVVVGLEGVEHKARLKGRDVSTDLALLELDATLSPAPLDDGEGAKVGHEIALLARPGETVRATSGIISARGNKPWRTPRGGEIDRYLESDAAHQPGYSGGALVSAQGKVLGLTTTGLLRHVSLTIPVPTVRRIVAQLETHGRVRKSYVGLSLQPVRLPDDVQKTTGEEIGLLVVGVEKGGPGEKADINYGDTVLHLGDDSVKTLEDFYAWLRADRVGQSFPARVYRNGKVDTVQVTLGARP
ncbi:MAG: trypsin-like peptidase domain-containing protein [Archangiaceae bacterium]|nr:trypsin-like peptidase domain-containing protein [Archangiaceae bacterium]